MGDIMGMSKGGYGVILKWYAYIHGDGVKRAQKGGQKWVKNGSKMGHFGPFWGYVKNGILAHFGLFGHFGVFSRMGRKKDAENP